MTRFSGLTFDAYDFYRNISESVSPEVGQLKVHFPPTFDTFDGTLKYDPKKKESLHVPVRAQFSRYLLGCDKQASICLMIYRMRPL